MEKEVAKQQRWWLKNEYICSSGGKSQALDVYLFVCEVVGTHFHHTFPFSCELWRWGYKDDSISNTSFLSVQRCVVVQEVFPDGLVAQDGRLQPGDQIIEVDGVDMTSATHQAVCQALRRPNTVLRLGVYRERIEAYRTSPPPGHEDLHGTPMESVEQGENVQRFSHRSG